MATIWLTYAWKDNEQGDVDFVAQELTAAGLTVKLDRWNIQAGKRLWEQIDNFIRNPGECDAWVLYATQNSLGSEPCKEEYAYALDRALASRGEAFPVVGLFPGPVERDLIPTGIRTRLYISTTDHDWKERIKAAAEGRAPAITRPSLEPYYLHVPDLSQSGGNGYAVEMRPRAGTWSPFGVAIPAKEKNLISPRLWHGARGQVPFAHMGFGIREGLSPDGTWWFITQQNEATPTQSYYLLCDKLPSRIIFGLADATSQQYTVALNT